MNALPQEKGGSISQLMNKRQDKVDKKIRPGFKLYGENRSDGTTYERDAMKSIQHDTPLNQMFFSAAITFFVMYLIHSDLNYQN